MLLRREKDSKQSDEIQARLQHYYPKNFRCNFTFYESENFSIFLSPLLHYIFECKNFRGLFYTKNSQQSLGSEMGKIVGNVLDKVQKLYVNGTGI